VDDHDRASASLGQSDARLHALVRQVLTERALHAATLVDLGCGQGTLASTLQGQYDAYVGCDVVRYAQLPTAPNLTFARFSLDAVPWPLQEQVADVVTAVEVIEHVENPRAFAREVHRILKPGGLAILTTPNQLSLLSKLTLVLKNQFNAFQERPGLYPAHITALLEQDLLRIVREVGFKDAHIRYTHHGRIPFTARAWPRPLQGRAFSDNVLLIAQRPPACPPAESAARNSPPGPFRAK
jgi:2-polyprenyl-3-methyl-5-hydroxy-6-metoxy-1,4-benzoquinol methylase